MRKEKLGITGLYIHCICSTATACLVVFSWYDVITCKK